MKSAYVWEGGWSRGGCNKEDSMAGDGRLAYAIYTSKVCLYIYGSVYIYRYINGTGMVDQYIYGSMYNVCLCVGSYGSVSPGRGFVHSLS